MMSRFIDSMTTGMVLRGLKSRATDAASGALTGLLERADKFERAWMIGREELKGRRQDVTDAMNNAKSRLDNLEVAYANRKDAAMAMAGVEATDAEAVAQAQTALAEAEAKVDEAEVQHVNAQVVLMELDEEVDTEQAAPMPTEEELVAVTQTEEA